MTTELADACTSSVVYGSAFGTFAAAAVATALWMGFDYRRRHYGTCGEIRLSDDGTCELETRRRVTRLHATQIGCVKYSRDSEGDGEFYSIRWEGGKLTANDRMTDFRDFLTRLKALNPAVELTSFPSNAWPGLRAPDESGIDLGRFLLPLCVTALLVFVAMTTLAGK